MKKIIISIIIFVLLLNSTSLAINEEKSTDEKTSKDDSKSFDRYCDLKEYSLSSIKSTAKTYKEGCCEGYTLLSVQAQYSRVILIDMDGKAIRQWWHMFPFPAKMLPGGDIISAKKLSEPSSHATDDMPEIIQENWNGEVFWNFTNWDDDEARQHHDFQREGNPVGYYAPDQEFIENGKTLILAHKNILNVSISETELIDDVIYEVDWDGKLTGFTWCANEHFDEFGFDEDAKSAIRVYPGCKCEFMLEGDWLHINSISLLGENHWYENDPEEYWFFHPDNIILDSRHANFIVIISRENGSIVWRVGPNYSDEGYLDQIIGPHHAHMIPKGLPGAGNILVFDNGGTAGYGKNGCPNKFRNYSRVIEFDPVTKEIVWEYKNSFGNKLNLLLKFFWLIIPRGKYHHFYSPFVSSAQRLPNGNTLITEGMIGRVFEVTNKSGIVWEYILPPWIPLFNYKNRIVYRAYRIPPEWVPGNPSGYSYWEDNI